MSTLRRAGFALVPTLLFAVGCSGARSNDVEPAALVANDAGATADGAQSDAGAPGAETSFVDTRDGQVYPLFRVGTQTWLGKNLNFDIPGASFCYDDDPANCEADGRLYTWSVARTACPAGFRLGTDADWKALETALGMPTADLNLEGYSTPRGSDEGTQLKSTAGFGAHLAGYRTGSEYDAKDDRSYFWTATTRSGEVWRRRVAADETTIFRFTNPPATFAISVRCVRDGAE